MEDGFARRQSRETIFKELLDAGYRVDAIQEAFARLASTQRRIQAEDRRFYWVLLIAVLLTGSGLFSFLVANWHHMGKGLKVVSILGLLAASLGISRYLRVQKNMAKLAESFVFLAVAILGFAVFLLPGLFSIHLNSSDKFVLWMIGAIGFAFFYELDFLLYFALSLATVALMSCPLGVFDYFNYGTTQTISWPLFLVASGVSFMTALRIRRRIFQETI